MAADAGMVGGRFDGTLDQARWSAPMAVIARLRATGHETYAVGGCVRDLLLGRAIHDIDIATSAHPDQVIGLFPRTIAVGRQFGVVVVVADDGANIEVASFRCDGAYVDGRRPAGVVFSTARDDVERRDFTINALLFDPLERTIADHVGGLSDLRAGILRFVGDARARVVEDRLRILRGLRFLAQLGFAAEPATWEAIRAGHLDGLSQERITQEWIKALGGERPGLWFGLLADSGHLGGVCAPLAGVGPAPRRTLAAALDRCRGYDGEVAMAVWLSALVGDQVDPWLRSLRLPNDRVARLTWIDRQARAVSATLAGPLAQRRRIAQHPQADAVAATLAALDNSHAAAFRAACADERARGPWRATLRASDLLDLGVAPGPPLGQLLRRLEDAELEGAFATRDEGLALAARWAAEAR